MHGSHKYSWLCQPSACCYFQFHKIYPSINAVHCKIMSWCPTDIHFCNKWFCNRINNTVGQPFYCFSGLFSPHNTATVPGQASNTNPLKHLRVFYNSILIHNTHASPLKGPIGQCYSCNQMRLFWEWYVNHQMIRKPSIHSDLNTWLLNG
jgi:hypothetical protein